MEFKEEKVSIISEEAVNGNPKENAFNYSPHLNPIHVSTAPSLLSRLAPKLASSTGEARNQRRHLEGRHTTTPLDLTGFKHLAMIVLAMGNLKVMCVDWNQFGFWVTLSHFGMDSQDLKMALVVCGFDLLCQPLSLLIEKLAATTLPLPSSRDDKGSSPPERDVKRKVVLYISHFLHFILSIVCLGGGSVLTWNLVNHPLVATGCEATVIVTFLKLVSFAVTNNELREAKENKKPFPEFYATGPQYPKNLTLRNSVYYWAIPTLIYQPVYPMRPTVRWSRVLPLMGELLTGMILTWVIMMQMGMPVLEHLVDNMSSWKVILENYLTLASISITIWLAGFFALFQSLLNLLAEVTKFADRDFYGDWWNAGSVGTFWRDWNRPVSNYFRRHIYIPLRTRKWSRTWASNAVFFVSALFHELLFGVATHNFNGVAFLCMMVQPIFIILTLPLEKKRGAGTTIGNCVFWVSILFGQPTATVIYYLEWVAQHPTNKSSTAWWTSKFL